MLLLHFTHRITNPRKTFRQPKPKTRTPIHVRFSYIRRNNESMNQQDRDSDLEAVDRCCRTSNGSPKAECSKTDSNSTRKVTIAIGISLCLFLRRRKAYTQYVPSENWRLRMLLRGVLN